MLFTRIRIPDVALTLEIAKLKQRKPVWAFSVETVLIELMTGSYDYSCWDRDRWAAASSD